MIDKPIAVLAGGLDSAVLTVELTAEYRYVQPVFVHQGLLWQDTEVGRLKEFFGEISRPGIAPVQILDLPVADLYGTHWSLTGIDTPDAATPDEAVYLPGKNLMLLAKVGVWCERNGVGRIALATLANNPFPDNSTEFYALVSRALDLSLGVSIDILRPYAGRRKVDVIRSARDLPLELTFSCIRPVDGRHCGVCNKCEERRRGFLEAGVNDRTEYAA